MALLYIGYNSAILLAKIKSLRACTRSMAAEHGQNGYWRYQ